MQPKAANLPSGVVSNKNTQSRLSVDPKDYEIYNFNDSGSGKSWLIGTNEYSGSLSQYANAFRKGVSACPEVLEIPGFLTDASGETKPVEIIGPGAFISCGCDGCNQKNGALTKILKIPRTVKVIRREGLASMNDLESFEIEAGSELETIEYRGLDFIGSYSGHYLGKRTFTLILPSTLSSVVSNGIRYCNLFHTVVYCGSHPLTNSSELEFDITPNTTVKVTSQYPSGESIFGRTPDRSPQTEAEAEKECQKIVNPFNFTIKEYKVTITGWWRPGPELIIPSNIASLPVIAVAEKAFENCLSVTGNVSIPSSVTSIGRRAFAGLRMAGNLQVAGDPTKGELIIGEEAFADFGADRDDDNVTFSLPANISSLGNRAFARAKVKKVTLR